MTDIREKLLIELRALNISSITAEYSGYGDSGQLEDFHIESAQPLETPLADLPFDHIAYPWSPDYVVERSIQAALDDFIWYQITSRYGGFENNDGGQGELTWNIATDTISLDHSWNITSTEHEPTVTL